MLSQKRLKELLSYDPETGRFTRKISSSNSVKAGDIAGGDSSTTGYWRISVDNIRYAEHRLAWFYMTGLWPKHQIDHIDHIRANNKWANLREVTHAENQKNRVLTSKNKSGCVGVSWIKARSKWYASISVNRKTLPLGTYENKDDAIKARKKADIEFGYHANHGAIA